MPGYKIGGKFLSIINRKHTHMHTIVGSIMVTVSRWPPVHLKAVMTYSFSFINPNSLPEDRGHSSQSDLQTVLWHFSL